MHINIIDGSDFVNNIYIFILCFFIFIFIVLLFKFCNIDKNNIFCFFITVLIILFVSNIEASINAALDGLRLCFKAIIPTIFSFSLICNLLICYDGISTYSKLIGPLICKPLRLPSNCSFPLVGSILCGYPLGAKFSSNLYENGDIEKKDYIRLINIASNTGPIFLIGSVGASLLGDPKYGYFLLISNYLSIFFIAIITMKKSSMHQFNAQKTSFKEISFSVALDKSIKDALNTTLSVCSYVVAFSVIISILKNINFIKDIFFNIENLFNIPRNMLYGTFLGSIELTNGCNIISSSSMSIHFKLAIISFLASFSGISIIAQTFSFIGKHNVSFFRYVFLKLIQGIFSFIFTFLLSNIVFKSIETYSSNNFFVSNYLLNYLLPILIFLIIIFIIQYIAKNNSKKLKN